MSAKAGQFQPSNNMLFSRRYGRVGEDSMLDVSAMLSTHTKKSAMQDIMAQTVQSHMPKKGNFPRMLANLQPAEDVKTEDMKSSTRSDEKI